MIDITDEVCSELQKRAKIGKKKYGERLTVFNGRNSLVDAFEEACELCCYLWQKIREEKMTEEIKRIRGKAKLPKKDKAFPF